MTRFDLRWIRRHPLRWARLMWLPWIAAAVMAGKAVVIDDPIYSVTAASDAWPVLLATLAGVLLACAVVPLNTRLQAFAGAFLFGVAVLRVLTYLDALVRAGLDNGGQAIVIGFTLHWVLIAALAGWWPIVIETAGRQMTVEAGADDRGGD